MTRHKLTPSDRARRSGARRLQALRALAAQDARFRKNKSLPPGLTAYELAEEWDVHPSSAFRVLQRLIRSGAVQRVDKGLGAVCWITDIGYGKIEWLAVKAEVDKRRRGR